MLDRAADPIAGRRPSLLRRSADACAAAALAAALVAVSAPPARAQSPLPTRDGIVANGTDLALSAARIDGEFQAALGTPYGLDGLFLMVPDCRPDPEVYLDRALASYGLAAADGQQDDHMLVWFVCTEEPRFAGFFWSDGSPYARYLEDGPVVDAMVEQLADGNYTGAAVDGIGWVADSLAPALVDVGGDAAADGVGGNALSSDGAGGGMFGGVPTWAILAFAAALGFWWWSRRARKPAAVVASARAMAKSDDSLADVLAALQERLIEDPPDLARLILLHQPLGEAAMLALDQRHKAMLARAKALRERAAGLERPQHAPGDLAEPPGSPEVLAATAAAEAYGAALAEARALLAYVDGLPEEAAHAEMLEDRAPILAVEARKAIAAATTDYATALDSPELSPDGLPSAEAALAFPGRLADMAEQALGHGRRLEAGELAEDAAALAKRVAAQLGRLRDAERAVGAARTTFDQIDDYAEASWADIRGNGSEADDSLDAAADRLRELVALDPATLASDPAAGFAEGLARVDAEVARALGLAAAIEERLTNIRAARDGAPRLIESVATEIAQARAWLARPEVAPEVGNEPATAIDAIEAELDALRVAAGALAPDWLAIRRRLGAADQAVDNALGAARANQERVAARRRQLETARTDGQASLAKAEQYAAAHRRDVGGGAAARLAEAQAAAARALDGERGLEAGGGPLEAALAASSAAWKAADELADTAYEEAAGDVRAADKQREAYRPRTDWLGPVVNLPIPRRSSGGGIFGGPSGGLGGIGGAGGFGGLGRSGGGAPRSVPRPSAWGGRSSSGGGGRSSGGGSSTRRGGGRGW